MANNIHDELEKWLREMIGTEGTCFSEKMKVYAPTCYGRCIDAVERLIHKINEIFGGSTTYKEAEGCWINPEGKTECEPVMVIEVGHHCTDYPTARKFVEAIRDYAVEADQQAISISQGSFYIIPRTELELAMEKVREEIERKSPPPAPVKD